MDLTRAHVIVIAALAVATATAVYFVTGGNVGGAVLGLLAGRSAVSFLPSSFGF